ncbi:MAG: metal ABC transporter ATP-binding protein [Pelosinus sp.]|nr:metal ABC transporter ATP-binding protein [Pelosinus sp.]
MIAIEHLGFSYALKKTHILKDLNLVINKGDYLSILGENGSGKSTLLKLLLKLLLPTEGQIINDFSKTAYVPQRFESLNVQFPITVYEVLNCYRKSLKIKDKAAITKCLAIVKMGDFANNLIGTLSGGQCQKIFIARALMGNPDLILLDEPSNGVDVTSQTEIYSLLKNINRNQQVTVISVEHNLKAAIHNSTLIYHLYQGAGHLCNPDEYINEYLADNKGGDPYAAL